jgi:hypothetical protein
MAKFLIDLNRDQDSILFANDPSALREFLRPVFINADNDSAFGSPWESFRYNNHWVAQKSGAFIGYSSHISVVPDLQLGLAVFVNTNGDDAEWPEAAYPILLPALDSILAGMQPPPPPVLNSELYIGTFQDPDMQKSPIQIQREQGTNQLVAYYGGIRMLLQRQELVDPSFNATILQAVLPRDSMSCFKGELSAADGEYLRFDLGPDPTRAVAARSVAVDGVMWGAVFRRQIPTKN